MDADKPEGPLRKGWTTGACATAAAAAAYQALLTGAFPDPVTVALPRGGSTTLALARALIGDGSATAGVIKDAGDDPDVTHGAEVVATVATGPSGSGVTFHAGEGIGTVTLPGLPLPVGEPAINPAPREMIRRAIRAVADQFDAAGDVSVTIAIPGGEALAEKTLNGRLGIKGGLSVLGTTGVVVPFSCAAWIHSIHRGIDVARALGLAHVAAATGKTSEEAVKNHYRLAEAALLDMGDFVGGTLKYLRTHPLPLLTIAGGFAKLVKLAQGHLFLHSSKSQVDMDRLADLLASIGAPTEMTEEARGANTAAQVLALAQSRDLPLANAVAARARKVALATVSASTRIEVIVFDRQGRLVGCAGADG
jgi:cobalt-precorrin-5B (C1)-methyltransferase